MDDRSHTEALKCYTGKPPALRGLPSSSEIEAQLVEQRKMTNLLNWFIVIGYRSVGERRHR